jgi:hypothetical protein
MEKYLLKTIFLAAFAGSTYSFEAQAQNQIFFDDYSNPKSWSQVGDGLSVDNGMVHAVRVPADFTVHKIYRELFKPLTPGMNWVMEMDFTNTSEPTDYNLAFAMALTPGTEDVGTVCTNIDGPCFKQHPLLPRYFINYSSEAKDDAAVGFAAYHPDSVGKVIDYIKVPRNQKVYFRITKQGDTYTFGVFSDAQRLNHVSGSPSILEYHLEFDSFNYIQHAVNTGGGNHRISSFELDNLSLTAEVVTNQVDQSSGTTSLQLVPNPVSDVLTITGIEDEVQSLSLLDIQGREVLKSSGVKTIAVGNLQKGMYLLKVSTAQREYATRVVVE